MDADFPPGPRDLSPHPLLLLNFQTFLTNRNKKNGCQKSIPSPGCLHFIYVLNVKLKSEL